MTLCLLFAGSSAAPPPPPSIKLPPAAFPNFGVSLGVYQLASFSDVRSLSVPGGATYALLGIEGNSVRYRDDGIAPTASIGALLPVANVWVYVCPPGLRKIQFIPLSGGATVTAMFYR